MRNCSLRVSLIFTLCALSIGAFAAGKGREISWVETRVESKTVPHKVTYEFNRLVAPGRVVKVKAGHDGEVRKIYRIFYSEGKEIGRELVTTEKTEVVNALFHMGRVGYPTSRGSFTRHKVLSMESTAYDPSPATIGPGATGRTYTGMRARFGVVAVDPRVIPLGSLLYVEGYGFAIASDIGSAIKGNRIDLCYMSRRQALRYGRKKVQVHVFAKR
jgi:3D (Asp-Asp-Asp) domain-containing protein